LRLAANRFSSHRLPLCRRDRDVNTLSLSPISVPSLSAGGELHILENTHDVVARRGIANYDWSLSPEATPRSSTASPEGSEADHDASSDATTDVDSTEPTAREVATSSVDIDESGEKVVSRIRRLASKLPQSTADLVQTPSPLDPSKGVGPPRELIGSEYQCPLV